MRKVVLLSLALFLFGTVSAASAAIISVNPTNLLTDYVSLGEWDTDGDFEGWSLDQVTNGVVEGGWLLGDVVQRNDPKVQLLGISGVDLSSGNFDILEIRFSRSGDMSRFDFFWGVGNQGFSATRQLTPSATLIDQQDAFYVVQFDMSDVESWAGMLTKVRFDPFSDNLNNTTSFTFDYVRVGSVDVPAPPVFMLFLLSLMGLGLAKRRC